MYYITSFYQFYPLGEADVKKACEHLEYLAAKEHWCGLVIIGAEGINATLGTPHKDAVVEMQKFVNELLGDNPPIYKDSVAEEKPFRRFKIKVRPEIVTIDRPDLVPDTKPHERSGHLTPREWQKELESMDENTVLIDTRNWYETKLGIFEGALDPDIEMFTEFVDYLKDKDIPKDKKVLMYCTGGIRCEKASLLMRDMGYDKVYQLEGGILKYMEEYPEGNFKGECFVFDHRVSVDKNLNASRDYGLCPLCGNPGSESICCENCGSDGLICLDCKTKYKKPVCSKNCRHHLYERAQAA